MATKILQISDIHYGADYNGLFNTKDQFLEVCRAAKQGGPVGGYDAVILTGDLVDDDDKVSDSEKAKAYEDIYAAAEGLCNDRKRLFVTPGNHDNAHIMTEITRRLPMYDTQDFLQTSGFNAPGTHLLITEIGNKEIVILDSGNAEPYKGIARLSAHYMEHRRPADEMLVFTHKPFRAEALYHRFMKDNVMSEDVGDLLSGYVKTYLCGHYHHLTHVKTPSMDMYVCPGVQCQIDPYSKECKAIAIPGFQVITYEPYTGSAVEVKPVILDDYVL